MVSNSSTKYLQMSSSAYFSLKKLRSCQSRAVLNTTTLRRKWSQAGSNRANKSEQAWTTKGQKLRLAAWPLRIKLFKVLHPLRQIYSPRLLENKKMKSPIQIIRRATWIFCRGLRLSRLEDGAFMNDKAILAKMNPNSACQPKSFQTLRLRTTNQVCIDRL